MLKDGKGREKEWERKKERHIDGLIERESERERGREINK